jgi:hypothetical protein
VKPRELCLMGFVCLAAADARSAGDHTQGTYICGAGLDTLDASGRTTGNCIGIRQVTPTRVTLIDGTTVTFAQQCQQLGDYWACPDAKFSGPSPKNYCDVPPNTSVPVVLVNATVSSGGFLGFGSDQRTIACGGSSTAPNPPDPTCPVATSEPHSAIDHCISWGYAPTGGPNAQKLFGACVRMARADYFGTGASATRRGIHIQPYTGVGPDLAECRSNQACCDGCFEASWDENGARCIAHLRLEEIKQD